MNIITKEMLAETLIKEAVSRIKDELGVGRDSDLSGEEIRELMNNNLELVGDIFLSKMDDYIDDEDLIDM